jgi:hypothetical protein
MTRQQWVRRICIYLILVRRAQDLQKQIEHGNNLEEAARCISDIITISQRLGLCEGLAEGLAVAGVAVKGLALQGLAGRLAEGLFSQVGLSEDVFGGLEDIVVHGLAVEDIAVEDIAMEGPTMEKIFDVASSISIAVRPFLAGRDSVSELEQRFRQSHVGKEGHLLLLAKILREDIDQGSDRENAVKHFIYVATYHVKFIVLRLQFEKLLDMATLKGHRGLQAQAATALADLAGSSMGRTAPWQLCRERLFAAIRCLLESDQANIEVPTARFLSRLLICSPAKPWLVESQMMEAIVRKVCAGCSSLIGRELVAVLSEITRKYPESINSATWGHIVSAGKERDW